MRLIDADALLDYADDAYGYIRAYAIDAVPVVRCRYCAFSEEARNEIGNRWCHKHKEFVPDDYYCAGGKR